MHPNPEKNNNHSNKPNTLLHETDPPPRHQLLTWHTQLLLLLPAVCASVYATLQVVPVHAPTLIAHEAKVATAADANSRHRRTSMQVLLLRGIRGQQCVLPKGEV
jgi:hypothetical protein